MMLKYNWLSIKVTNTAHGPLSLWTEYKCTVVLNTCVPFINNMSIVTSDWRLREYPIYQEGIEASCKKKKIMIIKK